MRIAGAVAALGFAVVSGRECESADVLPLATDVNACIAESKLSLTNATLEEIQRSCVFNPCRNMIAAMGSMNCTINNEPVTVIGSLCRPNATNSSACTPSDTSAFAPHLKQCQLLSGVNSVTNTTASIFCKYDICVQYTKLFTPLNCYINGSPASTIARYCDVGLTTRPPTNPPSVLTNSTTECTLDDTPLAYPDQLRKCLVAANLKSPPAGPADWAPLCMLDTCAQAVRYFAGLSCTVGGTPAYTLAKVCENTIPSLSPINRPPTVASKAILPSSLGTLPLLVVLLLCSWPA
ncbi:hypothetical protein DYB31_011156 [Aphanomyces astaci]|uniref:Uncharacterized protein n=1 Tax=Aphanomyces astaci TaxID=112090 RepID=A0A397FXF1_APHAT|nr:hypothetical protein DYB31_011156 [Aphanomyces astaci]